MRTLSVVPRLAQCSSLLVIALSFSPASLAADPGPPGGLSVNVVNTPANPVPVTGSLGVTGTANVNVTNTSANPVPVTGSIGVSGGVTVNNTTSNPVPVAGIVDVVPRQPYIEFATGTIPVGQGNTFLNFPTSAGKRYVIEFVSIRCTTQSTVDTFPGGILEVTKVTSSISTSFPGVTLSLSGPVPNVFGGNLYSAFANVKLYSDGGVSSLQFNVFHTDGSKSALCDAVVSGYVIPQS